MQVKFEILRYELSADGLPKTSNKSILITPGDGIVRAKSFYKFQSRTTSESNFYIEDTVCPSF